MLDTATEAAKKGGEVLARYFEMVGLERELKDDKTFATKADSESEEAIVSSIKQKFPDHGFLGEEGSNTNPDAEYVWVIDPLDGTKNFVNGIPIFAISVALLKAGEVVGAVIYNPVTHSLYTAEKGKGAMYNGKKVSVSKQEAAMGVVTFGPGQKDKETLNRFFERSEQFFKSKRYLGCTALELGYVARGGIEGFVCIGLKKWDYAAGALLVQEAGGKITDYQGKSWNIETNYFVASNGVAHEEMLALVSSQTREGK